jgi:hypothetical protein
VTPQPPVVGIKLQESAFGLGLMHDSLILEAVRWREINVTLLLNLIEGVLGYELITRRISGSDTWEFKRSKGFK